MNATFVGPVAVRVQYDFLFLMSLILHFRTATGTASLIGDERVEGPIEKEVPRNAWHVYSMTCTSADLFCDVSEDLHLLINEELRVSIRRTPSRSRML